MIYIQLYPSKFFIWDYDIKEQILAEVSLR